VEAVVISSHNPALELRELRRVRDTRLSVASTSEPRGCGHRWVVAAAQHASHLVVIDDDILLWPSQIRQLVKRLERAPQVPHGLSGLVRTSDGALSFIDRTDAAVDHLCEVYAVTADHLRRYHEIAKSPQISPSTARFIADQFDFLAISATGIGPPRIHDLGRVQRCQTFNDPAVAVHQGHGFFEVASQVALALERVQGVGRRIRRPMATDSAQSTTHPTEAGYAPFTSERSSTDNVPRLAR
jgi:hypothetical protein